MRCARYRGVAAAASRAHEAAERMTVVAELARRFPSARIVFTGGSGRIGYDVVTERRLPRGVRELRHRQRRIVLEDKSRDTDENARFPGNCSSRSPASAGSSSPRRTTCRARSAVRAAGFRSKPIRSITAPRRGRSAAAVIHPWRRFSPHRHAAREWVVLLMYRVTGGWPAVSGP